MIGVLEYLDPFFVVNKQIQYHFVSNHVIWRLMTRCGGVYLTIVEYKYNVFKCWENSSQVGCQDWPYAQPIFRLYFKPIPVGSSFTYLLPVEKSGAVQKMVQNVGDGIRIGSGWTRECCVIFSPFFFQIILTNAV